MARAPRDGSWATLKQAWCPQEEVGGEQLRKPCRTMPGILMWPKEGSALILDYQERSDPLLKMAVEFILEQ